MNKKSFTLIELLVVIAIIGILSSLVIARFSDWDRDAKIAKSLQWSSSFHSLMSVDLLGHWTFDGNLNDISGNNNHGLWKGGSDPVPSENFVDGVSNEAMQINIPYDLEWIDLGNLGNTGEGTISFWFNLPNYGDFYLFDGRDVGVWWILVNYVFSDCIDTDRNICFFGRVEIPSNLLFINKWHHVVATADSTETKIYLDGELIDTGVGTNFDFSSVRMGTRYTNTAYLRGRMDDVRIYSRILSSKEIGVLYAYEKDKHLGSCQ